MSSFKDSHCHSFHTYFKIIAGNEWVSYFCHFTFNQQLRDFSRTVEEHGLRFSRAESFDVPAQRRRDYLLSVRNMEWFLWQLRIPVHWAPLSFLSMLRTVFWNTTYQTPRVYRGQTRELWISEIGESMGMCENLCGNLLFHYILTPLGFIYLIPGNEFHAVPVIQK